MTKMILSALIIMLVIANVLAMQITDILTPIAKPTKTLSPNPWTWVTENVTQYFNVPKPTGNLLDGLLSYGDKILEPCLATAIGLDMLSSSVSETSQWCGFATVAPTSVRDGYSSYGCSLFLACKSETTPIVTSDFPIMWSKPG
ncbi:hypothetical protein F4679DRAFT_560912 [Xylaria curta]|nr:hypothetical protein F4679DRAFT_560912 [Xylaria curta]